MKETDSWALLAGRFLLIPGIECNVREVCMGCDGNPQEGYLIQLNGCVASWEG